MIKIDCPVYIIVPRKTKKDKKYAMNLGAYRNWKFIVSNTLKNTFSEALRDVLSDVIVCCLNFLVGFGYQAVRFQYFYLLTGVYVIDY